MSDVTSAEVVRGAGPVPGPNDASDTAIRIAVNHAAQVCRRDLDPERVLDVAVTFVSGYAMAVLHQAGYQTRPFRILEHARQALGVRS